MSQSQSKKSKKEKSFLGILIAIAAVVWIADRVINKPKSYEGQPTARHQALERVKLDLSWNRVGFGNVMNATFTITNPTIYTIRDIEITCDQYGNSGTRIGENITKVYDLVRGKDKKTFEDVNMGLVNKQASSTRCHISNLRV